MINIKKIKPMFTTVITTMELIRDKDKLTKGGLIDIRKERNSVNELQTVVEVGPNVRGIKVGDLVSINPARFGKSRQSQEPNNSGSIKDSMEKYRAVVEYHFDILVLNGVPHLKLEDRDINYVIEDYEVVEEEERTIVLESDTRAALDV